CRKLCGTAGNCVALQETVTDHNGLRVSLASVRQSGVQPGISRGGCHPSETFVWVRNLSLWFT
ncbi:MAG: hypothetical protein OSA98_13055, partial [Rubripirellula sp.]|nr:hypothetical protein [Rubripirellula sp.]